MYGRAWRSSSNVERRLAAGHLARDAGELIEPEVGLHRPGRPRCAGRFESADAHPQQTDAPVQRYPLEASAGRQANHLLVIGGMRDAEVARHRLEIVEAQLNANGIAAVALALEIVADPATQLGKDLRERRAVLSGM